MVFPDKINSPNIKYKGDFKMKKIILFLVLLLLFPVLPINATKKQAR